MTIHQTPTLMLSDRLKSATQSTHQSLDDTILGAKPFDSQSAYGKFLKVQYVFHRDVAPLYKMPALQAHFPGLQAASRAAAAAQDAADIGVSLPEVNSPPATEALDESRLPEALGWLYVVEGSNLGAAFLLKFSKKIGLSETHGARHLAEPAPGRALYWRQFKAALNGISLSEAEKIRAVEGSEAAFARVRALVDLYLLS